MGDRVIPVEQRYMAIFDEHGDNLQRGDCLTACIASIFELPIDEVPFFVQEDDWYRAYHDWVRTRGLSTYQILDAPAPCSYCDATGLKPSLHAIVMRGREIAWDPHPQRDMGHLGFVSGEQFGCPDPTKIRLA